MSRYAHSKVSSPYWIYFAKVVGPIVIFRAIHIFCSPKCRFACEESKESFPVENRTTELFLKCVGVESKNASSTTCSGYILSNQGSEH